MEISGEGAMDQKPTASQWSTSGQLIWAGTNIAPGDCVVYIQVSLEFSKSHNLE